MILRIKLPILISGLILWWPKNFKKIALKQSFKIKWNARFKRLNYDLHNVLGFYAMLITILLALTGVVWTYQWIANSIYRLAAGKLPSTDEIYTSKPQAKLSNISPLDQIFINAKRILIVQDRITLSLTDTTKGVIYVNGYPNDNAYYGSDDLQFDQYNAKLLTSKFNSRKNNGERLLAMNYDIHVGSIFGLSGKIIAFMASLIAASLPITGFIFWLGRRKKKKNYIHRHT